METGQDLRGFVAAYGAAHPGEVVRVSEPVALEHEIMAVVLEYERRRRHPILLFESVAGSDIPIVCNAVASRRALAFALGVPEAHSGRGVRPPTQAAHQACRRSARRHSSRVVRSGADLDLGRSAHPRRTSRAMPGDTSPRGCSWRAIRTPGSRPRATIDSSSRDAIA